MAPTPICRAVNLLVLSLLKSFYVAGLPLQVKKYLNVISLMDFHLPYANAWDLQLDLMQHFMHKQDNVKIIESTADNTEDICVGTVVICQHSATYTLGSATTEGSGPFSKKLADGSSLEYETFTVERAGQATYHGPGQLVVYPILDLGYFSKDINLYLRVLEQTIMETLTLFDIPSQRIDGKRNVIVPACLNFEPACLSHVYFFMKDGS